MKQSFWKTDWFTGVSLAIVVLLLSKFSFLQNFDHLIYDRAIDFSSRNTANQVAVIAIDDRSVETLGRWPWSRNHLADLISHLHGAQTNVIALTDPLTNEQSDPGIQHLQKIRHFYDSSGLSKLGKEGPDSKSIKTRAELDQLDTLLKQSIKAIDADANLTEAIKTAGNVLTRIEVSIAQPGPLTDVAVQTRKPASKNMLQHNIINDLPLPSASLLSPSLLIIENAALGAGHLIFDSDPDHKARHHPLVVGYQGEHYPSLALQIVANSRNIKANDIRPVTRRGIHIGNFIIPTDKHLQIRPYFYQNTPREKAFTISSAVDVLTKKLSSQQFKDKIVLIGTTEKSAAIQYETPLAGKDKLPEVILLAHTISSLMQGHGISVPDWGIILTGLAWLGVLFYSIKFLSTLSLKSAWMITGLLCVFLVACEFLLITQAGIWVSLIWPAILILLAHAFIALPRKEEAPAPPTENTSRDITADNNYALGKTFLLQGQLDWAFDKLKKCAHSEALMNKLSRLASRYEENTQFVKAHHVYQLMAKHDSHYPDLKNRLRISSQRIADSATVKSIKGPQTEPGEHDFENRTMLGRYQIEKELGKGAMGKVYLGKDTRINRVVAIKTLPLAAEFDESELETVKARFFREAETAGQLNHPNIVTIYDAGEEHGLAYIAMEFLTGHDLSRYTKANNLLPPQMVLGMIYKAAKALNYAHLNKVIHRDIKPANVMIEPDKKKIILTDFGIARITDASRTRTGVVLGTPSYMSPEQLSGAQIDGRSDLFALGVMLFQLLTGELPFDGDSLSMLMFVIANEPHRDISEIRPDLLETYPQLGNIIDKALAKEATQRYQSGNEMANALKQCAQK